MREAMNSPQLPLEVINSPLAYDQNVAYFTGEWTKERAIIRRRTNKITQHELVLFLVSVVLPGMCLFLSISLYLVPLLSIYRNLPFMSPVLYFCLLAAVPAILVSTKIARLNAREEYSHQIELLFRNEFAYKSRGLHEYHHDILSRRP